MYYLGIDGSTVYSRIVGINENSEIIGRHMGNSTNISATSYQTVKENIDKLIKEFLILTNRKIEDCKGLCIGSAGVRNKKDVKELKRVFDDIGIKCPVSVVSDMEIILATETKGEPAMVVFSGRKSAGFALDKNFKRHRVGGWGHLIDDGGSGYNIGMLAIKYALMSYDKRIETTILEEKVKAYFSIKELSEITKFVYSEKFSRTNISELAVTVKYASEEGDFAAKEIEKIAVNELFSLARGLINICDTKEGKLILAGNVLLLNDNIRNALKSEVNKVFPEINIILSNEKAEMGAAHLAQKL